MALDIKAAFMAYLESDGSIPFDLYAQDIHEWDFMRELVPGLIITSAGGAGLFQAEGFLDQYPFYFRSETGTASICVAQEDGEPHLFTREVLWYGHCDTDGEIFHFSREDFVREFMKCIRALELAPFLWTFAGKTIKFANDGKLTYEVLDEVDEFNGYGITPELGYARTAETSLWLEEKGWSVEFQQELWRARALNPVPINEDKRVWPVEAPEFLKLSKNFS